MCSPQCWGWPSCSPKSDMFLVFSMSSRYLLEPARPLESTPLLTRLFLTGKSGPWEGRDRIRRPRLGGLRSPNTQQTYQDHTTPRPRGAGGRRRPRGEVGSGIFAGGSGGGAPRANLPYPGSPFWRPRIFHRKMLIRKIVENIKERG